MPLKTTTRHLSFPLGGPLPETMEPNTWGEDVENPEPGRCRGNGKRHHHEGNEGNRLVGPQKVNPRAARRSGNPTSGSMARGVQSRDSSRSVPPDVRRSMTLSSRRQKQHQRRPRWVTGYTEGRSQTLDCPSALERKGIPARLRHGWASKAGW